jgi:twitching motility protein PilI
MMSDSSDPQSQRAPEAHQGSLPGIRTRLGLQEFQARLLQRMEAARDETMQVRRLGAMIGGINCLIDLSEAGEIIPMMPLMPLTRVPLTRDWYLGLANIRGNLVGIVDLQRFQGGNSQAIGKDSRLLTLSASLSPNCGLLLTQVLGLRHISEMMLQPGASASFARLPGVRQHYRDKQDVEWTEIGLTALLSDPDFLRIGL